MKGKKLITAIAIGIAILALTACGGKKIPKADGILGQWYEYSNDTISNFIFYDDGTYVDYSDNWDKAEIKKAKENYKKYKFDEEKNKLSLGEVLAPLDLDTNKTLQVTFDNDAVILSDGDNKVSLYRSADDAKNNNPAYYTSDEFCNSIKDNDGFAIKNGIMYAYLGKGKKITIPSNVNALYNCSLSWDCNHGVNLEEVTVPGTVSIIDTRAFSFCVADKIVIKEGVMTIGDDAFMDSYIDEIWFPASVTVIGNNIMDTEEGLNGCKIHVVKGSAAAKYFEKNMPYGDAKLIYE